MAQFVRTKSKFTGTNYTYTSRTTETNGMNPTVNFMLSTLLRVGGHETIKRRSVSHYNSLLLTVLSMKSSNLSSGQTRLYEIGDCVKGQDGIISPSRKAILLISSIDWEWAEWKTSSSINERHNKEWNEKFLQKIARLLLRSEVLLYRQYNKP